MWCRHTTHTCSGSCHTHHLQGEAGGSCCVRSDSRYVNTRRVKVYGGKTYKTCMSTC
jgi:hypothetical protein